MPFLALFALICLVIGEIYLFIQIGGQIGASMTILAIFATAFLGLALMRWQGLAVLKRARADLARGTPPFVALGHGVLILLAGLLLLVPGFLTDAFGFLLLLPPIRHFIAELVIGGIFPIDIFSELAKTYAKPEQNDEQVHFDTHREDRPKPSQQMRENGDIIDAEFNVEDERNPH